MLVNGYCIQICHGFWYIFCRALVRGWDAERVCRANQMKLFGNGWETGQMQVTVNGLVVCGKNEKREKGEESFANQTKK
jgi:hypothetical protein